MAPEMQTNRRWIRSWLPWNRDRIFSLMATGPASGPISSEEQDPATEPLCREGNTGAWVEEATEGESSARRPPRCGSALGLTPRAESLPWESHRPYSHPLQWADGPPKDVCTP